MITEQFNVTNTRRNTLLGETDPEPVTVIQGSGPLVFTFPHNSTRIPSTLDPTLNMDPHWFEAAHESHDLYMQEFYEELKERFPDATYIIANYSRLVADVNRIASFCVEPNSSEDKNLPIIGNNPPHCDTHQMYLRQKEFWQPYHSAIKDVIDDIRQKHGGVIKLDMHSFSPEWLDPEDGIKKKRSEQIGTLRAQTSPLACLFENYIKNQQQYSFVSGKPYRAANRYKNAARSLTREHDLQYLGVEVRNDLIATPQLRREMADFINKGINDILSLSPDNLEIVMAKASIATKALGTGIFKKCCGSPFKSLECEKPPKDNSYDGFDWMI